jgi:hypothetical protein
VLVDASQMRPHNRCMRSSAGTVCADHRPTQFFMVDLVHLFFVITMSPADNFHFWVQQYFIGFYRSSTTEKEELQENKR